MMISPENFMDQMKNKQYKELIKERDRLIRAVRAFEKGKISYQSMMMNPTPEVIYQMNLRYLAKICDMIADEYCRTYVWKESEEESGE